ALPSTAQKTLEHGRLVRRSGRRTVEPRSGWKWERFTLPGEYDRTRCGAELFPSDGVSAHQGDLEPAAPRLGVRQLHAPALVLADPLHQRQPQAEPFPPGRAAAHEGLEHRLALGGRDAHATVLDHEALLVQAQADASMLGVVQRVAQQVA